MKKLLLGTFIFFSFINNVGIVLSSIGVETNRFNNFISNKIYQSNNNINLQLNTIKFKINLRNFSMFLETTNSELKYRNIEIPVKNIKVFSDIKSLLSIEPKIKKIDIDLEKVDINQLKLISRTFKPSNLNSFINNKIYDGTLDLKLQIFLDENNEINNFILKGKATNLNTKLTKIIYLKNTNFSFFSDKSDILIQKFSGKGNFFEISEGDLKIKLSEDIQIESNFKSKIKYNVKSAELLSFLKDFNYLENLNFFDGNLNNNLKLSLDKTYKIKDYNLKSSGDVFTSTIKFSDKFPKNILKNELKVLSLKNSKLEANYSLKNNSIFLSGKYSLNNRNFLDFNLANSFNKNLLNLKLNFDYDDIINFNYINFKKPKDIKANIELDFEKNKENFKVNKIKITENKNLIEINKLMLKKNKIQSFKNLKIKTYDKNKINNDFKINYGEKIVIKGLKFDSTKLFKNLENRKFDNLFSNINKEIEIDFIDILIPFSEKLKSFKLIGKIKNGKFIKISSKGDFGNENFLDISMKQDKESKKKYLEIYSDLPRPLLSEYKFFKSLIGGKLLFTTIIDRNNSISNLKIENFKIVKAPGVVKLLSLADLGGLADLAAGDGLSFDILEIKMIKQDDILKLDEILAIGPSISVLMEGYQNKNHISLRGTLVPAKTLNKLISKIPLIGDIVIPKEAGEGIFGISFKMKGPPENIKTTINPIRTITPRFIQKIIEKNKNSN